MNNFKKYPLFFSLLTVLLLGFAGMFVFNIMTYSSLGEAEAEYENAKLSFEFAVSEDPTENSVVVSTENVKELEKKLEELIQNLSSSSSDIIKGPVIREGYQLQNHLREEINALKRLAKKKDINVDDGVLFAYTKYYRQSATPPLDEAVDELSKQFYVLKYIIEKLYESKIDGIELSLDEVKRETLSVEIAKAESLDVDSKKLRNASAASRRRNVADKDNDAFVIGDMQSAKKEGSIKTYAYKLTFRTKTEVFRNFINSLKDFDLMLVVRDVVVTDGDPISKFRTEKSGEGGLRNVKVEKERDETLDYSNAISLVEDKLSKFVVTIEFIEVSKDAEVKKESK